MISKTNYIPAECPRSHNSSRKTSSQRYRSAPSFQPWPLCSKETLTINQTVYTVWSVQYSLDTAIKITQIEYHSVIKIESFGS